MYQQERRLPPTGRPPRPNVKKRTKYHSWGLPLAVGLVVALMAWVGLSALFSLDDQKDDQVKNAVSQPMDRSSSPQNSPDQTVTTQTIGPGPAATASRTPLVVESPMAQAALKVSPVSSRLDTAGVGQGLIKAYPVRTAAQAPSAAGPTAAAQPTAQPQPAAPAPTAQQPLSTTGEEAPITPPTAASNQSGGLRYTVHLGSFELKANADRALAELQAAGVPAFITKIELNNTTYYRLMAGKFDSEAQAAAYGQQIVARGLNKNMDTPVAKPLVVAPGEQ